MIFRSRGSNLSVGVFIFSDIVQPCRLFSTFRVDSQLWGNRHAIHATDGNTKFGHRREYPRR